jgi:hypothetical protein
MVVASHSRCNTCARRYAPALPRSGKLVVCSKNTSPQYTKNIILPLIVSSIVIRGKDVCAGCKSVVVLQFGVVKSKLRRTTRSRPPKVRVY